MKKKNKNQGRNKKISLEEFFARGSELDLSNSFFSDESEIIHEKSMDGAKRFKRNALGFFGRSSIKSLDEFAELLLNTGLVPSIEYARKIIPQFDGKYIQYCNSLCDRAIGFEKIINSKGEKFYKLCTGSIGDPYDY